MVQEGAEFSKLRISYVTENNRILKAIADIKAGEECLFVPKKVMVTMDGINQAGSLVIQKFDQLGETSRNFA